jgi:hypothetical protein
MPKKGVGSVYWGAFYKEKKNYKDDKHHKETRCRAEVDLKHAQLVEEQKTRLQQGPLQARDAKPDATLFAEGASLLTHPRTCLKDV